MLAEPTVIGDIFSGRCGRFLYDDRPPVANRFLRNGATGYEGFHADERGMLSVVSLVTMLFFLLLVALVANVGHTVNHKIETQNAADACAYTAAVEMARGMNAITATNHLLGEMLSIVIVHRAIGGPELETNKLKGKRVGEQGTGIDKAIYFGWQIGVEDIGLPIAYQLANTLNDGKFKPFAYKKGPDKEIKSGATARDGKMRLKTALTIVYGVKLAAYVLRLLKPIPYIGPVLYGLGMALGAVAHVIEGLILLEWKVLDLLETVARNSAVIKIRDIIYNWLCPNAYSYMKFVAATSGSQASRAAMSIAELNGFRGATWNSEYLLEIPVRPEPYPGSSEADSTGSGLIRTMDGLIPGASLIGTGINKATLKDKKKNDLDSEADSGASEADGNKTDERIAFHVPGVFEVIAFYKDIIKYDRETGYYKFGLKGSAFRKIYTLWRWEFPDANIWRSQIVMATYPWVLYDRKLIMIFSSWMMISNTSGLWRYYTNAFTIERTQYISTRDKLSEAAKKAKVKGRDKSKPALAFIIKGSNWLMKGHEMWTGWVPVIGPMMATSHFSVHGMAHRPAPTPFAGRVFPQQNTTVGELAYARAMIYNANAQNPVGPWEPGDFFSWLTSGKQQEVGWDLLNWEPPMSDNPVREWRGYAKWGAITWPLGLLDRSLFDGQPKIQLNWQAKMVPAKPAVTVVFLGPFLLPEPFVEPAKKTFLPPTIRLDFANPGAAEFNFDTVPEFLNNH